MYFEIANIFTIISLCCCHDIENVISMPANGTAIEGVCVTGAANRPDVPFVGMELSRWQAGMAQFLPSRCAWAIVLSRYKEIVIR